MYLLLIACLGGKVSNVILYFNCYEIITEIITELLPKYNSSTSWRLVISNSQKITIDI